MQSGNYDAARRTRDRLVDDMRLLDDLGWEPVPEGDRFELTVDPPELARPWNAQRERAHALHDQIARPLDEVELARRALVTQTTCGAVLAQMAAEGTEASRV